MDGFVEGILSALGGDDEFVHLAGVSLEPGGWIQMEVFLRRELLPLGKRREKRRRKLWNRERVREQGVSELRSCAQGAELCFLNAHLAAHTEKVKQLQR